MEEARPCPAGPGGRHVLLSCVRFLFVSGSWRPVRLAPAPARGCRRLLRTLLRPRPRGCSWGAVGLVVMPRLILPDAELGSARGSSCPPVPETARPHARGTVKARSPHFRADEGSSPGQQRTHERLPQKREQPRGCVDVLAPDRGWRTPKGARSESSTRTGSGQRMGDGTQRRARGAGGDAS